MTWEWYYPESCTVWFHPYGSGYKYLYRIYADYLNWHRPRGHKVKWKKIDHIQKEDAEKIANLAHERHLSIRTYLEIKRS